MAMAVAGFSGGQAEELRRAMGFKRSVERMASIIATLREGMTQNGVDPAAQDEIVKQIGSFALYGFPESHAASFALLAYASAYIRAHHPACFLTAMLNHWPLGFYSPATLVQDSARHGVRTLPIDVQQSDWLCHVTDAKEVRLGLRYVDGLRRGGRRAHRGASHPTSHSAISRTARACTATSSRSSPRSAPARAWASGGARRSGRWPRCRAGCSRAPRPTRPRRWPR